MVDVRRSTYVEFKLRATPFCWEIVELLIIRCPPVTQMPAPLNTVHVSNVLVGGKQIANKMVSFSKGAIKIAPFEKETILFAYVKEACVMSLIPQIFITLESVFKKVQ